MANVKQIGARNVIEQQAALNFTALLSQQQANENHKKMQIAGVWGGRSGGKRICVTRFIKKHTMIQFGSNAHGGAPNQHILRSYKRAFGESCTRKYAL